METAKAVVEVPSPQEGKIVKCYGKPGDIIKTGQPLVAFENSARPFGDKGTVVGKLEESATITEDKFTIGRADTLNARPKTTPSARLLAKKLGLDLTLIKGTGDFGVITLEDVQTNKAQSNPLAEGFEPLRGVRRAMLIHMVQSHREVVPVSIFDEADIHHWEERTDITIRLIRAIIEGTKKEPALNSWFDSSQNARKIYDTVHLGLAMDSDEGLFVPVIQDAAQHSDKTLRTIINNYKKSVQSRSVPPEQLQGATITLSNFGKFAGKFASPIIVPPMVAILAVGRIYESAVSIQGEIKSHRLLPLSLSFDHRAVTGGEATRFLGAIINSLQK
jgi:2-oxoisovalerate dehydrogenase E2 component (dihydrolipoyl transacylase)